MTTPGVPVSPGLPPLERTAQSAIAAARSRLDVFTGKAPQFPKLSEEERKEALEKAKQEGTCTFCGGIHHAPSTPACPRLATFKLNGDGKVIEGTFWPDGVRDTTIEMNAKGEVVTIIDRTHDDWDVSKVLAVADAAEEEEKADDGARA